MPYRPDRRLIPVETARAMLAMHGEPVARVERVALDEGAGRVLARDLVAARDVPPFARSMMDGVAVRAADTAGANATQPVELALVGSVFTGHAADVAVGPGQCAAIATGAPLPAGADAVVMVEDTSRDGDRVAVLRAAAPRQHVGRAGSDLAAGEIAARAGTLLSPARIGVAAALGLADLEVYARPRVAILSTGDEIVAPGGRPGPAQIFDSNTSALSAAVRQHGGEPVVAPRTGDDRAALAAAFARCLGEDLVLFSGGTSVGERDYLLEVIAEAGTIHFEGLLLKPGKPTVFATVAGRPVFGMPGNPVSCLTNAYLLVAPLLRRMAHLPPAPARSVMARLASAVESPAARHQIYPVRIDGADAVPVFKGSGEITSLAHADGYFEIPAGVEAVETGAMIQVTLF
jgi:molybdenum cofactor synthesis domain-containing protein